MDTEIIDNMVIMEDSKMEEAITKELMCPNRYCYVHKVLQILEEDMEEICHNCGFDLKPWKPSAKSGNKTKPTPKKKKVKS